MLSVISLPGTKELWFGAMISGRSILSLLANTLDISLYTTLHKLIGLRSFILMGFGTFGINTTQVSFHPSGKMPSFKKCSTSVVISFPTIS
jgi:hypothetical protein